MKRGIRYRYCSQGKLDERARRLIDDVSRVPMPSGDGLRHLAARRRRSRVVAAAAAVVVVLGVAVAATTGLGRGHSVRVVTSTPPTSTFASTTSPSTPKPPATLPRATTPPSVPTTMICLGLSTSADGSIAPLFCSNGADNPGALAYYQGHNQRGFDPKVLQLPTTASRQQVVGTICSDLAPGSPMGLQTEQQAYQLAANLAGWRYNINVVNLNCSAATPTTT